MLELPEGRDSTAQQQQHLGRAQGAAFSSWPTTLALHRSCSLYLKKLMHVCIHNKSPFSKRKWFQRQHRLELYLHPCMLNTKERLSIYFHMHTHFSSKQQ